MMMPQIGEVIAGVDAAGVTDNTIVSFVGDHGWALGEHGAWKYLLWML